MSEISCTACDNLREDAPDFVLNGVTNAVCASLRNNTGLAAGNGNDNFADMTNAVDCLIGNMANAIMAYDVCDWKDFSQKFIQNNYEVLKALLCDMKGQWNEIDTINAFLDSICPSIDNIFKLIQGGAPKNHLGEWTQYWKDRVTFSDMSSHGFTWSWDYFKPTFQCDISEGAGCDASKRLGRYRPIWAYTDQSHQPYTFGFRFSDDIAVGQVIGTLPMSAVVGEGDMSEDRWKRMLRSTSSWRWGTINGDTLLFIGTLGYVIIDGVTFNSGYSSYGENTMVFLIQALVGSSTQGGYNGTSADVAKSYNL